MVAQLVIPYQTRVTREEDESLKAAQEFLYTQKRIAKPTKYELTRFALLTVLAAVKKTKGVA